MGRSGGSSRRSFRSRWVVVRNARNFSFSAAMNIGAARASGELLLFLNNDVQPIERGWLRRLVTSLERPGTAIAGGVLVDPNRESVTGQPVAVQHDGIAFRLDRGVLRPVLRGLGSDVAEIIGADGRVAAVAAACALTRKRDFEQRGGFDERFRYGGDDIDLSLRLAHRDGAVTMSRSSVLLHRPLSTRRGSPDGTGDAIRANHTLLLERWGPALRREYALERPSAGRIWNGDGGQADAGVSYCIKPGASTPEAEVRGCSSCSSRSRPRAGRHIWRTAPTRGCSTTWSCICSMAQAVTPSPRGASTCCSAPAARRPPARRPRTTSSSASLPQRATSSPRQMTGSHNGAVLGDGLSIEQSIALWRLYTAQAIAGTADDPRMFVGYRTMLGDPFAACHDLAAFLDAPERAAAPGVRREIEGWVEPNMRHHERTPRDLLEESRVGPHDVSLALLLDLATRGGNERRRPVRGGAEHGRRARARVDRRDPRGSRRVKPVRLITFGSVLPEWGGGRRGGVATFHATLVETIHGDGELPVEVDGIVSTGSGANRSESSTSRRWPAVRRSSAFPRSARSREPAASTSGSAWTSRRRRRSRQRSTRPGAPAGTGRACGGR